MKSPILWTCQSQLMCEALCMLASQSVCDKRQIAIGGSAAGRAFEQ